MLAGGVPYKNDGGCPSYLLGVKTSRCDTDQVLKSKITTVKIITVPFRVLSRKKYDRNHEQKVSKGIVSIVIKSCQSVSSCLVLELVPPSTSW